MTCVCGTIGSADMTLRQCPEHHRYYRGDRQLVSVTKVLRSVWPIAPDFSQADPAVLEHARERGCRVDRYFAEYLREGRVQIPSGEWQEVVELLEKLIRWWKDDFATDCRTQVMLGDDQIAGTADFVASDMIADLKTTYNLEAFYPIQLGAYADLYQWEHERVPNELIIVHLAKRFTAPKVIVVDVDEAMADWRLMRQMWEMLTRRGINFDKERERKEVNTL